MLITLYEEDNTAKFSSKFTTPLTLPKNSTIQLLKAYLPRDHQVTIDGTNNEVAILIHTQDTSAVQHFTINQGTYGLQALANELNRAIDVDVGVDETNDSGQLRQVDFSFSVDIDNNNHGAGSFILNLNLKTRQPNFYYRLDFTDVGNNINSEADGHFESAMDTAGGTFTLVKGDGAIRPSVKQTGGGAVINKWDNHAVVVRDLKRDQFAPTTTNNMTDDSVMRIAYANKHTLVTFKINDLIASGNSFWIGIRKQGQAIDTTGVGNTQLDQVINITGLESCMVFYGTTANGKTAGRCEFYENVAGTFTNMGRFSGATTTPIIQGDKILMLIPLNDNGGTDPIEYKLFKPTTNSRYSPRIANPHRFVPSEADNYELCFGWYNQGATNAFTDLRAGMNGGYISNTNNEGSGVFDEFGKFCKVFLNGAGATANNGKDLKTRLGYAQDDYEDDKTAHGHEPAVLQQANEGDMVTNDLKQPYLNVNINNLPVVSYTCADPSASSIVDNTQHNLSKCVASIPRFNQNGSYDNGAIIFDDNTQSIQLNNVDECELSSLDIRLQNCDGTYPTDLRTPASFVFKISGDNNY